MLGRPSPRPSAPPGTECVVIIVVAASGCTQAALTATTPTAAVTAGTHPLAPTLGQFQIPSASSDEIARIVIDNTARTQILSTTVTVNGDTSDATMLFGCTGRAKPLGYTVFVDAFAISGGGMTCTGQAFKNIAPLVLHGTHDVTLTLTGTRSAYAILLLDH